MRNVHKETETRNRSSRIRTLRFLAVYKDGGKARGVKYVRNLRSKMLLDMLSQIGKAGKTMQIEWVLTEGRRREFGIT
jgi:hypothetical protein